MADGEKKLPRPRQVTFPAVLALSGCVVLVLSMFDAMANVRSVETRETWERLLDEPPMSDTGLGVGQVIGLLPWVVSVSGALGAAGAVLAFFVLQRHRAARTWLGVVAGLLLVSASVLSQLPVLVAVGAALLWSRDVTDWLEGRAPAERPAPAPTPAPRPAPPAAPARPTAEERASWAPPQAPAAARAWAPPVPTPAYPRAERPPRSVLVATWLTWVFCGLAALFGLLLMLFLTIDTSELVDAVSHSPRAGELTRPQLLAGLWGFAVLCVVWSLAAIGLGVLAYRRSNPARILLAGSAVLSGVVATVVPVAGWGHALAGFTAAGLLLLGSANTWYAAAPPR